MSKNFLSNEQAAVLVSAINGKVKEATNEAKGAASAASAASEAAAAASIAAGTAISAANGAKETAEAAVPKTAVKDDLESEEEGAVASVKAVKDAIAAVSSITIYEVVEALPAIADAKTNVIYLVPKVDSQEGDVYDEYIFKPGEQEGTGSYEKIGTTEVDLSDYAKKEEVEELISENAPEPLTDEEMEGLLAILRGPGVDLGLPSGTKWLSKNIGADAVTDNGEYYAFGEPYTKSVYGFRNYLQMFSPVKPAPQDQEVVYNDVPAQCSAWTVDRAYDDNTKPDVALVESRGIIGADGLIKPEFDIAALTNDEYRMPTKDQVDELWNNTTHTYDAESNSIIFTASNGNSISFPCSGCISGNAELESNRYTNPLGTNNGVGFGLWTVDGYGTDDPSKINWFEFYGEFASITCQDGATVKLAWVKDGGACRGLTVRPVVS